MRTLRVDEADYCSVRYNFSHPGSSCTVYSLDLGTFFEIHSIRASRALQNWKRDNDRITAFCAEWVVAVIISSAEERDERWSRLASDPLAIFKPVLQNPLTNSNSLLLANLLFIIRQTVRT